MCEVGKDTAGTEVGSLNNSNRRGSREAVDSVPLTEKQGRTSFPPCWLGAGLLRHVTNSPGSRE